MATLEDIAVKYACSKEKVDETFRANSIDVSAPDIERLFCSLVRFTSEEIAKQTYTTAGNINTYARTLEVGSLKSMDDTTKYVFTIAERSRILKRMKFESDIETVSFLENEMIDVKRRMDGFSVTERYISFKNAKEKYRGKEGTWWQRVKEGNCKGVYIRKRWYVLEADAKNFAEEKPCEKRYGIQEFADSLGISNVSVYNKIRAGIITVKKDARGRPYLLEEDRELIISALGKQAGKKTGKRKPKEKLVAENTAEPKEVDIHPNFLSELEIACRGTPTSRPENKKFYRAASVLQADLRTYRDLARKGPSKKLDQFMKIVRMFDK